MGVLVGGAILAALLIVMVAVFAWQGGRSRRDDAAVYVIDDAAAFVHGRLAPPTAARVSRPLVYRVLEWQIEYQQVVAPRAGEHPVIGSGDAIEHVLSRAAERGDVIDPIDVAEIIAADVEYLMEIHAVGAPAEEGAG
ncbi:MAG TPA: hypothetical protein VJA44_06310 [Acidimicrobiia bacterium]|nr:hypothetical protein [Acidimicrobiia bacterium]